MQIIVSYLFPEFDIGNMFSDCVMDFVMLAGMLLFLLTLII